MPDNEATTRAVPPKVVAEATDIGAAWPTKLALVFAMGPYMTLPIAVKVSALQK